MKEYYFSFNWKQTNADKFTCGGAFYKGDKYAPDKEELSEFVRKTILANPKAIVEVSHVRQIKRDVYELLKDVNNN